MLRRIVLTAGVLIAGLAAAGAAEQTLSAYDFAIDPDPHIDQRVTLTGCWFGAASLDYAQCGVHSKTGMVGTVSIDVPSMSTEDRRFLTTECAGLLTEEVCIGNISGVVRKSRYDIRLFDAVLVR